MVFEKIGLVRSHMEQLRSRLHAPQLRHYAMPAFLALSLTAGGAWVPLWLDTSETPLYSASASVRLDTSGNRADVAERTMSQVERKLMSPAALGNVVADLDLQAHDINGQQMDRMGFLSSLLFDGMEQNGGLASPAEVALQQSVSFADGPDGHVSVNATAARPETAQRIADYLSSRMIREIAEAQAPGLAALEEARSALDHAQAALSGFQMRNGNEAIERMRGLTRQVQDARDRATQLSLQMAELEAAQATLTAMKRADLASGALPELAAVAPLEAARQSLEAAELSFAEVNVDHGPKHPRSIAAKAAVDAAKAALAPAARQAIEAISRDHMRLASTSEQQSAALGDIERQLLAFGGAPVELEKLETALEQKRRAYLLASEKTGPFAQTPYISARPAEKTAPIMLQDRGTSTALMSLGGAVVGFLLSLFALSFWRFRDGQIEAQADERAEMPIEPDKEHLRSVETIDIEPGIFDDIAIIEDEGVAPVNQDALTVEDEPSPVPVPHDGLSEIAANDMPLDDRVRQILLANRVSLPTPEAETEFTLPPLLAAALAGRLDHPQAAPDRPDEELDVLRQELARLKELLALHREAGDTAGDLRKTA